MTDLSFLIADAGSESVNARTPMERLARAAGARFERHDGWMIAVDYGDAGRSRQRIEQTVGFADCSNLAKLELQAGANVLAEVVRAASGGLILAPGLAEHSDDAWWCPVTPERVLVLAEPAAASSVRESVGAAASRATDGGETVTVVDVTCGLAGLTLAGPQAPELLARFCAIDVRDAVTPVRGFRPGSVARTPGYVLREREQRLVVLVGWALGEYLWRVVADAAERLGGGPIGAEALVEAEVA